MKLGVNVDHVATLRQARGTSYPSPLEAARLCEKAGADGITIHLREDRRHIQDADVYAFRKALKVPLNLEMANSPGIVEIAVALGAPVVELHTGKYCDSDGEARAEELRRLVEAARHGRRAGLRINAGHGLNYENLPAFLKAVPHLDTLNIGHSIVARAVMVGMEPAVREMKALLP